jgi:hypothetical protein
MYEYFSYNLRSIFLKVPLHMYEMISIQTHKILCDIDILLGKILCLNV